jgi:hypothetical protein
MLELNALLAPSEWEKYWTLCSHEYEELPPNTAYVIFEGYCDNVRCDCERLTAAIMKIDPNGKHVENPLAVISYSWSSAEKNGSPVLRDESPKTPLAAQLLKVYKKLVERQEYVERVKRQYDRVKRLCLEKNKKKTIRNSTDKFFGRNDLCSCGSGKKFKKCCLQKNP